MLHRLLQQAREFLLLINLAGAERLASRCHPPYSPAPTK